MTDKTRADVKGGTLIQYEGKVTHNLEPIPNSQIVNLQFMTIIRDKLLLEHSPASSAGGGPGADRAYG